MKNLLLKLTQALMNWCERTGRVFKITGTGGPDDVYLIRYYVIKSRWFNFFIHQFLRSDRDDLHDHPWDFCTYLLRGAYTESKYNAETGKTDVIRRANYEVPYSYQTRMKLDAEGREYVESFNHRGIPVRDNTFVFRRATDQHKVVVDVDLKECDKAKAALTLFFSGPTKRDWGFIVEEPLPPVQKLLAKMEGDMFAAEPRLTRRTWIKWTKYLGLPDDTPTRG